MRGLTIILTTADPARFDTALRLACAQAALGGRVRIYADNAAVALFSRDVDLSDANDLGVQFIACQSGLADHGLTATDLASCVETGGMVGLLAELGEDRLMAI